MFLPFNREGQTLYIYFKNRLKNRFFHKVEKFGKHFLLKVNFCFRFFRAKKQLCKRKSTVGSHGTPFTIHFGKYKQMVFRVCEMRRLFGWKRFVSNIIIERFLIISFCTLTFQTAQSHFQLTKIAKIIIKTLFKGLMKQFVLLSPGKYTANSRP